MLSTVLLNLVSLLDIAMLGRLGAEAVAAVGYATQFYFLLQSVLAAVGFACVALISQSLGAGDAQRARRILGACLAVALAAALLLGLPIIAAPHLLLQLLGASPAMAAVSSPYLFWVVCASPLLAISLTLESALRANKDTRTPMLVASAVTVIKIAGNALLIFGLAGFPELGVRGAGIATFVSQVVGLLLFTSVALAARPTSPLSMRWADLRASRKHIREVARIAAPSVGERLAHTLSLLVYFRVLSSFGPLAIAIYTVGVRMLSFSWIPGTAFGMASSALVGQALGAGQGDEAARSGWRATRLALIVALSMAVLTVQIPEVLAGLFTNDAELISGLVPFLICLAACQPALQAHFALAGSLRGAGDTWTPFVVSTTVTWGVRVPLATAVAWFQGPVVFVWLAMLVDHSIRAAWLALAFRSGRWRSATER
jgi:putative MATE family efflux protein